MSFDISGQVSADCLSSVRQTVVAIGAVLLGLIVGTLDSMRGDNLIYSIMLVSFAAGCLIKVGDDLVDIDRRRISGGVITVAGAALLMLSCTHDSLLAVLVLGGVIAMTSKADHAVGRLAYMAVVPVLCTKIAMSAHEIPLLRGLGLFAVGFAAVLADEMWQERNSFLIAGRRLPK